MKFRLNLVIQFLFHIWCYICPEPHIIKSFMVSICYSCYILTNNLEWNKCFQSKYWPFKKVNFVLFLCIVVVAL